ncbi:unnamed protein product [Cuscuta epithymum]|uniref:Uncharacterized protein n=1 Tax=Cuscuta epithymum TaxID=186058 RepID=A0AAV0EWQ8_9ASTE|nr:unnamed protein product [Cuscuta epithymum]
MTTTPSRRRRQQPPPATATNPGHRLVPPIRSNSTPQPATPIPVQSQSTNVTCLVTTPETWRLHQPCNRSSVQQPRRLRPPAHNRVPSPAVTTPPPRHAAATTPSLTLNTIVDPNLQIQNPDLNLMVENAPSMIDTKKTVAEHPYEDEDNRAPHLRQSYYRGPTASKNRSKKKKEEEVGGAAILLERPGVAVTCR